MTALRAHFDGRVLVFDEPVELPVDRPLVVHVEQLGENGKTAATQGEAEEALRWIQANAVEISGDVNASVENMYLEGHDDPR